MNYFVSRENLLDRISKAADSEEDFLALRDFIFDYYAAEDNYVFESEELEKIFAVLLPYLHFEETFGDRQRTRRLKRLEMALKEEFTPESAVLALEYERISSLLRKLETEKISDFVFKAQLRKLSPLDINWRKVLELYKSHPELYDE